MGDRVDHKGVLGLENTWNIFQTANPFTNTDPFPCADESTTQLHNDSALEIRQFVLALRKRPTVGGLYHRPFGLTIPAHCRNEWLHYEVLNRDCGRLGRATVAAGYGLTPT